MPVGLGLYCDDVTSGPANWFQILSTNAGNYAENNSQFIDVLLKSL